MLAVRAGTTALDENNVFEPSWPPIRYGYAETHTEELFFAQLGLDWIPPQDRR